MVEATVIWHKFPEDPPNSLEWGRYLRYMIALDSGYVLECSWLNGGWHERHDGCSERTKQVEWWSEKPSAPTEKEKMSNTIAAAEMLEEKLLELRKLLKAQKKIGKNLADGSLDNVIQATKNIIEQNERTLDEIKVTVA